MLRGRDRQDLAFLRYFSTSSSFSIVFLLRVLGWFLIVVVEEEREGVRWLKTGNGLVT
jgi:hypothetical protein